MPANEQTWRDSKLLHKVFGVTSALMLLATIWMFAADHDRPWKPIQRMANDIDMRITDWRKLQFRTEDNLKVRSQLEAQLENARRQPVDAGLLKAFEEEVRGDPESQGQSFQRIEALAADLSARAGQEDAAAVRRQLINSLRDIVVAARHREDMVLGDRKFKSANRDAAVAALGILVRDSANLPPEEAKSRQEAQQRKVDELKKELDELTGKNEEAKDHRRKLDDLVKQMTKDEDQAQEALDKNDAEVKTLEKSNVERRSTYIVWFGYIPLPGKRILELPILDAFNSPRKIENLWSSGNDIDIKHTRVRRFDRCTTCHQLAQKTMAGSAIDPAYLHESLVDFRVAPGKDDASNADPTLPFEKQLEKLVGVRVAAEGLLASDDATVQFVRPESPAATARSIELDGDRPTYTGLEVRQSLLTERSVATGVPVPPGLSVGDVVVAINGVPAMQPVKVASGLLDAALTGKPFDVTVRRGMPNPYTSHPRLDLFVGSLSPHSASQFACTVCHEGQGSATAFQWASHTPNSVSQRKDWTFNRGWFDNPHWMYPMYPKRFAESTCLKCHHDVAELEASQRFPDAPAPTVVHGYHLILKYGCYGCHEINGYDGGRRIGPDLRLEPNFFAAAQQVKNDPGYAQLSDQEKDWLQQLIDHPDREAVRHRLLESLSADAKAPSPRLARETYDKIVPLFRDVESPGDLRKVGPSLRFSGHKLDPAFLYDWIREPKHFRPNTRMPQFFGLTKHLEGSPGIEDAKQFEPLEILGVATYLRQRTQPFAYLEPPAGVTESADKERGRVLFETRGCLACHTHQKFPDTAKYRSADAIVQGPDLSGLGDKFTGDIGRKWLYSWIKEPTRYHARTVMPNLFLEPIKSATDGKVSDPAADIVEYLLAESRTGWEPAAGTLTSPAAANIEQLDRLVIDNLAETFARHRATEFAGKGIPERLRGELKGPEVELVVPESEQANAAFKLSPERKLMYLGRKTIGKYGCYGCHDVPGFEDAKPIGTTLADWGRKDTARLAFEHIGQYLEHAHAGGHGDSGHTVAGTSHAGTLQPSGKSRPDGKAPPDTAVSANRGADAASTDAATPATDVGTSAAAHDASEEDREYFNELVKSGNRAGFIYQKLLEPRSYDYHKTENKRYNERLRMPQFPFSAHDREAVVTFVLGLVADPPSAKYIYQPREAAGAVWAGRKVLEKYNCGGCHLLSPQTWKIAFKPDRYGEQPKTKTFPFVAAHFDPETLAKSAVADRAGLVRAMVQGVPTVDDTGWPLVFEESGDPVDPGMKYSPDKLELPYELLRPAAINGHPYNVGVLPLGVRTADIEGNYDPDGGFLARYLLPRVVALEKKVNPAAKGSEGWGWLPPPLFGEGSKVQPDWLHSFLLDPYLIRPATFLRMPRFNMSPAEASALVNYFAAVDGAEFPYTFQPRQQVKHLEAEEAEYQQALAGAQFEGQPRTRLADAMRAVVNNNYCVKCHLAGDFEPTGSDRAKAPNLAAVYRRLRPEYMRKWIANPKSILPYTSMPENIPYDPNAPNLGGISQDLYRGTSIDQVDALVDLLMNYDEFAKRRSSVADLVKQYGGPPAPPDDASPSSYGDHGSSDNGGTLKSEHERSAVIDQHRISEW